MKKHIVKLFSSVLLLLLISCTSDEIQKTNVINDVYVSGSKASHATYWKNNTLVSLTDIGYTESSADTLIIRNNDIHVLGRGKVSVNEKTLYWKNNVLTNLTDTFSTPTELAVILSMDVDSNNDVYFAGITQNISVTPNTYDLVYWKNGIKHIVDSFATEPYHLIGIKVINNNIYLTNARESGGTIISGYYLNNTYYASSDFVWGVNASNSDVYVYGRINDTAGGFYKSTTTNVQTNLSSIPGYGLILPIYSMCFDNGDVYAVNECFVYKNGNLYYTTPNNSGIENFDVKNNSLYLLNTQGNTSGNYTQAVLKDGVLLMQNSTDELFTSLFVN